MYEVVGDQAVSRGCFPGDYYILAGQFLEVFAPHVAKHVSVDQKVSSDCFSGDIDTVSVNIFNPTVADGCISRIAQNDATGQRGVISCTMAKVTGIDKCLSTAAFQTGFSTLFDVDIEESVVVAVVIFHYACPVFSGGSAEDAYVLDGIGVGELLVVDTVDEDGVGVAGEDVQITQDRQATVKADGGECCVVAVNPKSLQVQVFDAGIAVFSVFDKRSSVAWSGFKDCRCSKPFASGADKCLVVVKADRGIEDKSTRRQVCTSFSCQLGLDAGGRVGLKFFWRYPTFSRSASRAAGQDQMENLFWRVAGDDGRGVFSLAYLANAKLVCGPWWALGSWWALRSFR